MFTQPFHEFHNHNAFLSEGGALPVVVGDFPETAHQTRDNTDCPVRCGKAKRGCASRVPPSPAATARRTRGVLVVRATHLFGAGAPSGGSRWATHWATYSPRVGEVALTTVIPADCLRNWSDTISIKDLCIRRRCSTPPIRSTGVKRIQSVFRGRKRTPRPRFAVGPRSRTFASAWLLRKNYVFI